MFHLIRALFSLRKLIVGAHEHCFLVFVYVRNSRGRNLPPDSTIVSALSVDGSGICTQGLIRLAETECRNIIVNPMNNTGVIHWGRSLPVLKFRNGDRQTLESGTARRAS
jgi:hypothetical protein